MTQAPQLETTKDVVQFLVSQHEQLKAEMPNVLNGNGDQRRTAWTHVRKMLATHEAMEQEAVHPQARRDVGADVVEARISEETAAERAISRLESIDPDTAEFEAQFTKLETDVISHAEHEEHEEFTRLEGDLSPEQAQRINIAASLAMAAAQDTSEAVSGETFAQMFTEAKRRIESTTG
jgi:hypothetical protein